MKGVGGNLPPTCLCWPGSAASCWSSKRPSPTRKPYTGETPPRVDHHRLGQRGDADQGDDAEGAAAAGAGRRQPLLARAGVCGRIVAVTAAGTTLVLLLAVLPGPPGLLFAVAIVTGVVRGMFTLLEATIVSDYWSPAGYASLNGIFSAPLTAATAVASTVVAAVATATSGYPELFVVLAGSAWSPAAKAMTPMHSSLEPTGRSRQRGRGGRTDRLCAMCASPFKCTPSSHLESLRANHSDRNISSTG